MKSRLLPPERMNTDYPWLLWAVGWLGILKAVLWLAYEPVIPEPVLRLMGLKYLLSAPLLIVCAVALWHRKRWAVWGLAASALAGLLLLLVVPRSLYACLVDSEVAAFSVLLSAVVLVCAGPVGDVLILCATPALLRLTRRTPRKNRRPSPPRP